MFTSGKLYMRNWRVCIKGRLHFFKGKLVRINKQIFVRYMSVVQWARFSKGLMEMPFAYFPQTSQPHCGALHKVNDMLCTFHNSWQNAGMNPGQDCVYALLHAVSWRPTWVTTCISQPTWWCIPVCSLIQSSVSLVSLHCLHCPLALKKGPFFQRGHKPGVITVVLSWIQGHNASPSQVCCRCLWRVPVAEALKGQIPKRN